MLLPPQVILADSFKRAGSLLLTVAVYSLLEKQLSAAFYVSYCIGNGSDY
jgi:hypothetical protein